MIEKWLEIKEWPGYFISNTGKVKRSDRHIALCPNKNRNNYVYVYHSNNTIRPRALSVHRLVARYFIPNPENKPCVNHIDNNPQNNLVENLEWVTHQENIQHCISQGRSVYKRGEECAQSVLSEKIVRKIKSEVGSMTYKELAKKYGTNYSNIAHIKRGSRWGHVNI